MAWVVFASRSITPAATAAHLCQFVQTAQCVCLVLFRQRQLFGPLSNAVYPVAGNAHAQVCSGWAQGLKAHAPLTLCLPVSLLPVTGTTSTASTLLTR